MLDNLSSEYIQKIWGDSPRPIDVYKFAKKIGIIVTEATLPNHVFSVITHKINTTPRIQIAIPNDEDIKKFSCAVAIGFFFQNKILKKENYQQIYFRSAKTMEEKIAHRFAVILLAK